MFPQFAVGVTVDMVKHKLAGLCSVEYGALQLYHSDALMIDPLSLNDFPFIKPPGPINIRVDVADGVTVKAPAAAGGEGKEDA